MNRLILIGNGFDLAHSIKSNVSDFIEDYLLNVANTFLKTNYYEDELIKLSFKESFYGNQPRIITISELFEFFSTIKKNTNIIFTFKSLLLTKIYEKYLSKPKWVDIEMMYFQLLTIIANQNINHVDIYNSQFDFLKEKFIQYLKKQNDSFDEEYYYKPIIECFTEKISKEEIVLKKLFKDELPKSIYILNFNYTNTIKKYQSKCNETIDTELNNIHGNLNEIKELPIFGFGDEFDKKYLEFEEKNSNNLFHHIKSFKYLLNQNYHSLIRFVERDEFQVHIYGHSCGLSDRTMLNQIFEHSNCLSIKILYHEKSKDENDFTEKTYEISRHLNNKNLLRKKLVPYNLTKKMPQPEI